MSTNEIIDIADQMHNERVQLLTNRIHNKDTQVILNEFYRRQGKEKAYIDYIKKYNASVTQQYEKPLELTLVLTNDCNYLCKMCYRNFYTSDTKVYFPDELLDLLLNEAKELNIPSITLSGGEPTLHPHISDIIKKVSMVGFLSIRLTTNGFKLNNENLLETIINAPLTCLSVSLDAATPKTYKNIRGGDLNIIERNIELFLNLRAQKRTKFPLLYVSMVNMPVNNHEIEQFTKKWTNIADTIEIHKYSDMNPNRTIKGEGGLFVCDQPYKRILIDQNGQIRPCFFAQYQVSTPIYLGKDYNTLMDYWNSDWHLAFCDSHKKRQYCDVCERCRESFI